MNTLNWAVWIAMALVNLATLNTWLLMKRSMKDGHLYDTSEVVTVKTLPRFVVATGAILIIFLFLDLSSLHLIWIYVVVYFLIAMRMSKRVLKADEDRLRRG